MPPRPGYAPSAPEEATHKAASQRRLPCIWASPIALGCACAAGLSEAEGPLSGTAIGLLAALVVTMGIVHGALWDLAFAAVARLPTRLHALVWLGATGYAAVVLARSIGVFARWGGRYHHLAIAGLVICSVSALLLSALLIALQPSRARPNGRIASASLRARILWALALTLCSAALFVADRRVLIDLYPAAHLAMRLGCLWLAMFAAVVIAPKPRALVALRAAPWLVPIFALAVGLAVVEYTEGGAGALGMRNWTRMALQAGRHLTDVDLDGYSALLAGGDCAPLDPRIHPGMTEIPDNGIDENCLLGDAKPLSAAEQLFAMPSAPPPMDVVLITVDSLRTDRVGAYSRAYGPTGYATTPEIDAFARNAVLFENVITPGGWTSIAVSSLMRGVYARQIEWTRRYETNRFRLLPWRETRKLDDKEWVAKMFALPRADSPQPTLAQWLTRREMRTIAVVDDEFSALLSKGSEVAPGFQSYTEVNRLATWKRDDADTAALAIRAILRVPAGQRFFLWVHFFGPHSPTRLHPGVRLDGSSLAHGYEHEIRYADREIGRLLRAIHARGAPTAVFLSADHGEEFLGRERHHGFSVADAAIRVPLIAKVPGWKPGRVTSIASLVDLMPTILQLTNSPLPKGLDGIALQQLLDRDKKPKPRVVFVDTWQHDHRGREIRAATAALDGRRKATFDPIHNAWTLETPGRQGITVQPVDSRSRVPLVRALSRYVESSRGLRSLSY